MSEPLSTVDGESRDHSTRGKRSDEGSPSRLIRRLLLVPLIVGATLFGLVYQSDIAARIQAFVPDPSSGREVLYWRSPMDPSVRSDKPGKTPMGMDLVPVFADDEPTGGPVIIHPEIQEREYTTALVETGPLIRSLESMSTVTFAEPLIGDVTLKMEVWLEKLYVNYEGQTVKKNDPLFEVYAPALIAAEEEFLISQKYADNDETSRTRNAMDNLQSARIKLQYLDMTADQIDQLAREGVVQKTLTYYSPFSGIVIQKQAFEGKAIPAGRVLYRIADLSKVWINVFIYENQIHCVGEGQRAVLTLSELPDRTFQGEVTYIYPYLDPKSRTIKVRLEFDNPDLMLMPDMFGQVKFDPHRMGDGLSVPQASIMHTGTRNLVYVALAGNRFEAREVSTGMELDGGRLEILDGLQVGERVVTSPDFLLDSESRIRLMNRKFRPLPHSRRTSNRPETESESDPETESDSETSSVGPSAILTARQAENATRSPVNPVNPKESQN